MPFTPEEQEYVETMAKDWFHYQKVAGMHVMALRTDLKRCGEAYQQFTQIAQAQAAIHASTHTILSGVDLVASHEAFLDGGNCTTFLE
jgi:urease accessory protein UreF